jgi:ribosomal protein S18 acetylase RimI-like enzyme
LAIDNSKIIGYQAFYINNKKARLIRAGVLREYRRRGIAALLIILTLK